MSTTTEMQVRGRSHAFVPASLAAGAGLLLLVGGTLFSEFMFEHHDLAQKSDPWSLFFMQALHPFGLTGLISDSPDHQIGAFASDSPWLVLLGLVVALVGIFLVTLLALGSLAPGRSTVAVWVSSWFATIIGGGLGGLVVGVAKALGSTSDNGETYHYPEAVVIRVWMFNGVAWGFTFGAFIGLLALLVWVVQRPSVGPVPGDSSYPPSR